MLKKCILVTLAVLLALPAVAQDAKTVIANASKAMGYDQLRTIEYSGSGFEGTALGQAQSATGGWPKFTLKSFSRYVDLNAGSGQTALRSRPLDPSTGQLAGGGGLAATPETQQVTAIAPAATWAQKLDISLSPPGFLKLASAATNATVSSRNVNGRKYTVVSFPVDAKAPSGVAYSISGYINSANMIDKVETTIEEPNLIGDMLVEQSYSGYKDFGGVKFPTQIVQKRAGLSWTNLAVTDVKAKWFSNSRTLLMPDKLAQSGKKPKFEYVGAKTVLKEGTQAVELYHLKGALHAEDIIVAYLPALKTVIEADAFNAPAPNAPAPQTVNGFEKLLASELDRLKIDYTTIIPVHQPAGGDRDVTKADCLRTSGGRARISG